MPAKVVGAGSEGTPESGGGKERRNGVRLKKEEKREKKKRASEMKKRRWKERKKEGRREREREGRKENKKTEEEGRGWFGEERKSEQTRPVGGDLRNGRGCWCRRDKK